MSPKYFIKTYGCQMNEADSAKLKDVLESSGYEAINNWKQADLILVNTCVVRQHAEDRAAGFITSLSGLKNKNPNIIIGVCGCMVPEPERDLKKMFPHVDFFIPPNNSAKLAEYLHLSFDICHWSLSKHGSTGTSYVSIMHGCDNYCSYCVVPYVRGREYSRPMDEVLAEIQELWNWGTRDIILLGQNVNSYKYGLANLLRGIKLLVVSRKLLVRFMTSHPRDMSDAIIEAVAELPFVAKEFHLPVQSGDNEILRKMNRGYTVEFFKGRVERIRSLMPAARITTDMLVGFPGETEEQFEHSLDLIKEVGFNAVNMFAYSSRPQTAAAGLPHQLPDEIKQERLQKLIELNREVVKK